MTKAENIFLRIIEEIPNAVKGNMFGAISIKAKNGKTGAFFWENNMVFTLDEPSRDEALKLTDANVGSHLYAPEIQMKGWITIPLKHSDKWIIFAKKSLKYVEKLER